MFSLADIQVVRGGRPVLSIESLHIPSSSLVVILGTNGSGKSTLAGLLSGQLAPDAGTVALNACDIGKMHSKALAKEVAFLPQTLPPCTGLSVSELVRLGRFAWRGAFGAWRAEDERIIQDAIHETGMQAFANSIADALSGGERQRAWIAMLLAQKSRVMILDEPTSALDIHHQYQIMALLAMLNLQQRIGVVVILHDLNLALRYATHIVALKRGTVAFSGDSDILLDEQRLSDLYDTQITLIDAPFEMPASKHGQVAIVCA